ncbi:MAG: riboflavin synthase [Geminicoccaceae bacterium]|nr:riboflavin synthase [Geminicoccaceae bacterium]
MFTGIVTDIGRVLEIDEGDGRRLVIGVHELPLGEIPTGGSIATSGICFTAVDKGSDWFALDASAATLDVTTAGRWRVGERVNLERSLRVGDEMGGHIVFGHVDAIGEITALDALGESHRLVVCLPVALLPLVAVKGSIAFVGISLTVNRVERDRVTVNVIPHSWARTNLADRRPGDPVNVEVDMLARYVARQLAFRAELEA